MIILQRIRSSYESWLSWQITRPDNHDQAHGWHRVIKRGVIVWSSCESWLLWRIRSTSVHRGERRKALDVSENSHDQLNWFSIWLIASNRIKSHPIASNRIRSCQIVTKRNISRFFIESIGINERSLRSCKIPAAKKEGKKIAKGCSPCSCWSWSSVMITDHY